MAYLHETVWEKIIAIMSDGQRHTSRDICEGLWKVYGINLTPRQVAQFLGQLKRKGKVTRQPNTKSSVCTNMWQRK